MKLDNDLKESFENHGAIVEFNQSEYLQNAFQRGVDEANREGVCWEVCRRWVRKQLGQTLDLGGRLFPQDVEDIRALIVEHASHNKAGVDANYLVSGAVMAGRAKRKYGGVFRLKAKGLTSREAVIAHMYNDPGLYIFGFYKKGGHAVAFNITDTHLVFFDPNRGQFTVTNPKDRKFFKKWFSQYWGRYYKDEYTLGQRDLTKYGNDPGST